MKKKNLFCIPLLLVLIMILAACNGNPNGGGDPMTIGMYGEIADFMAAHPTEYTTWEDAAVAYIESRLPAEFELVMRITENNYDNVGVLISGSSEIHEHRYVKTSAGIWLEQTSIDIDGSTITTDGGIKIKNGTGGADDTLYLYDSGSYGIVDSLGLSAALVQKTQLRDALFSTMTWYGSFGAMFNAIEQAMGQVSQLGFDFNTLLAASGITFEIDRNATQTINGTSYSCERLKITTDDTVDDPAAPSPTYHVLECYVDKTNGICLRVSDIDRTQKVGGTKTEENIIETRTFKTSGVTPIVFPTP